MPIVIKNKFNPVLRCVVLLALVFWMCLSISCTRGSNEVAFDINHVASSRKSHLAISNPIDRENIDATSLDSFSKAVNTIQLRCKVYSENAIYFLKVDEASVELYDIQGKPLKSATVTREDLCKLVYNLRRILDVSADRLEHRAFLYAPSKGIYPGEWHIGNPTDIEIRLNNSTHVICINGVVEKANDYPEIPEFKQIFNAERSIAKFASERLEHKEFADVVNNMMTISF